MDAHTWQELQHAFEHAVSLEPAARAVFLDDLHRNQAAVHDELMRLLDAHDHPGPLDRLTDELNAAAESLHPPDPPRLGAWRIDALIGRGGMGSVYRAERADGQFRQRAALKLLRRDVADPDLRRRFLVERSILARIEHPGIARLLDGGVTEEGRPWFAMEFVEGQPIDAWCSSRGLAVRERLRLFREVCAAVQHAHAHLVVHRDLKPANILVTADGHAKLLDFGIARLLDPHAFPDEAGGTRTGALLLTPKHASPEQLRGESVGTASDVFQLGLLLFELLVGRLPRRDERPGASGETLGERPSIVAPPSLRRAIDGDLDTIVLAATRDEADRRYASVDRLAEDVQRWLDRLPIRARPDTLGYRTGRFVRRHRAGVAATTVLMLALTGFGVITSIQASRLEAERDRARRVITFMADLFEREELPAAGPTVPLPVQQLIQLDAATASRSELEVRTELRGIAEQVLAGSSALRRARVARSAAAGARLLWVDDNPESNRYEIMLLQSLGATVRTVTSTEEAKRMIETEHWDLVLSDMARDGHATEGLVLLDWLVQREHALPVVFYVMVRGENRERPPGSFGITNEPGELIHLVFDVLERRRS